MLEPIERPGSVEDVTTRIRHAIFAGALAQGERLVEDDLAAKLGVSRAPIRDALKALERDGLVASAGRRGKVVTSLSSRDAWEVYSLRATLEAMAFRLVMEHPVPRSCPHAQGHRRRDAGAGTLGTMPLLGPRRHVPRDGVPCREA